MSEKSTPTPQETTGTKQNRLVPTALILGLAGVGAYGIYTGNVSDWVRQGIDKVANPTEIFAFTSSEEDHASRGGREAPNLFPDDHEPTFPDTEAPGAQGSQASTMPADASSSPLALSEPPGEGSDNAVQAGTGNSRYLDDLSQPESTPLGGGSAAEDLSDASVASDDYQLEFDGSSSSPVPTVAAQDASAEESGSPEPAPLEGADAPSSIPGPEEMEEELARIMAERESGTAAESDALAASEPPPSSEVETLSETERQQIIESPEFTGTIAAIGRRVGQAWEYEGDDYAEHGAIVKVHLEDAGEVGDINISRSSGNDAYDTSVIAAANAAAPFPEVLELDDTSQTLLTNFSLTFGSRDAIEAWEAQWTVHEPVAIEEEVVEEDPRYAAQVRRMIEAEWDRPDNFDADSEVSVQVRLAVPFGNVLAINFLRSSDDEAINDSIDAAIRAASPFDGIRQLSLKEQQELQQFNLHFRAEGIR